MDDNLIQLIEDCQEVLLPKAPMRERELQAFAFDEDPATCVPPAMPCHLRGPGRAAFVRPGNCTPAAHHLASS